MLVVSCSPAVAASDSSALCTSRKRTGCSTTSPHAPAAAAAGELTELEQQLVGAGEGRMHAPADREEKLHGLQHDMFHKRTSNS
jgi:hypothetical protein